MPLITNRDNRKKVPFESEILEDINRQIMEYCAWSGVADKGYFIEEAAKYIFSQDQLWKKHLEAKAKGETAK